MGILFGVLQTDAYIGVKILLSISLSVRVDVAWGLHTIGVTTDLSRGRSRLENSSYRLFWALIGNGADIAMLCQQTITCTHAAFFIVYENTHLLLQTNFIIVLLDIFCTWINIVDITLSTTFCFFKENNNSIETCVEVNDFQ